MSDMWDRIKKYEKKGYIQLSVLEVCERCGNGRHSKQKAPIYMNPESDYCFCSYCGARWKP